MGIHAIRFSNIIPSRLLEKDVISVPGASGTHFWHGRNMEQAVPGSAGVSLNAIYFLFLRAGGADGAIARRWSVAKRRATPGNGEEENQALEGRQIIQIKGMSFNRPCRGFSCYALQSWGCALLCSASPQAIAPLAPSAQKK